MKEDKIDFVVLWVDPSDKKWQESRAKYAKEFDSEYVDNSEGRYRDWGLFKYWFRGVEKFAPWVNKVHLVTCGHVPKWLNVNHPKLHIVKHSDFMPRESLPTFNSNAIELCMHKIPGLSEDFVAFNDDMFIIKKVNREDFFKNGLPVNTMSLLALTPSKERMYTRTLLNNIEIINRHFSYREFKKESKKYLSLKQGKYLFTTLPLLVYGDFPGFKNFHIGNSYQKSTFDEVWKREPKVLKRTVFSRFRDYEHNVNHWLMNYWQFAEDNYYQRNSKFGININMANKAVPNLITRQSVHIICLSDVENGSDDVDSLRQSIISSFDKVFPDKSEFEL